MEKKLIICNRLQPLRSPYLDDLVTSYATSLTVSGSKATGTVKMYQIYLNNFLNFIGQDQILSDMNLEVIEGWHKSLLDSGKSQQTCASHLIGLRNFLRWLEKRGHRPPVLAEQVELPKYHRHLKDVPSYEEVKKLLTAIDARTRIGLRDRAIIELFISSGMRVSELTSLNVEDVDLKERKATITGKGNKQRLIFFSPAAAHFVGEYLKERNSSSTWLFIRHDEHKDRGARIASRSIERMLSKYEDLAKIKRYSVHALRHFYATYLLSNGADLFSVSRMLGHANISTTSIYLHASDPQLASIHGKVFNKSDFVSRKIYKE